MYIGRTIKEYINDLAARKPTPGGGSAAALCGAIGTALLEMVCNFTIGNERYKAVESQVQGHLESLKRIEGGFRRLVDEDVAAYSRIRDAFKAKDKKIIDSALKAGYDICLNICRLSREGLGTAGFLSEKGNSNDNLITDVGCGAELLNAAFNSGVFNCEINLKGMEDKEFVKEARIELERLKDANVTYKDAISKTRERI